jgi:glutaryl-CoA dehydrogenase
MENKMAAIDFYRIDDILTETERMVQDTVRSFVETEAIPYMGEWCTKGVFPLHLVKPMAEMGLLGAVLPEAYGGAGLQSLAYGLIMQELERGDSSLRSFASVQNGLVMHPIYTFGTEEQRKRWLPKLASGELIGCYGLTEPEGGSNPGGIRTRARKDGGDWVINGNKMWITNATISHLAVVFAQTGDKSRDIRGFVVEKGTPGFTANPVLRKIGLRASDTGELVLEDCRVPDANLLPGSSVGVRAALECLDQARYGIAFGAAGAASACLEEALEFSSTRTPFDRSIDHYQITQKKLADIVTDITAAQLINLRLAQLKDNGTITPAQVSLAKRNNVRKAFEAARTCREILGANGITYEFASGRHEVNLISVDTYEGTYDIHTLVIGADLTGKPAFR